MSTGFTGVTELGTITLGVSDLDNWMQFASTVLGMEVVPGESGDIAYLRMDYWHHRIKLVADGSDDLVDLSLRLAGVLEFRAMAKALGSAGVPVRVGTPAEAEARQVLEVMFVTDPNGYPVELFHGPLVQYDLPFHPGRRMHGSFKTALGGFGHVMLNRKADFEAIHAFYTMLGLRGGIDRDDGVEIGHRDVQIRAVYAHEFHEQYFLAIFSGQIAFPEERVHAGRDFGDFATASEADQFCFQIGDGFFDGGRFGEAQGVVFVERLDFVEHTGVGGERSDFIRQCFESGFQGFGFVDAFGLAGLGHGFIAFGLDRAQFGEVLDIRFSSARLVAGFGKRPSFGVSEENGRKPFHRKGRL